MKKILYSKNHFLKNSYKKQFGRKFFSHFWIKFEFLSLEITSYAKPIRKELWSYWEDMKPEEKENFFSLKGEILSNQVKIHDLRG